QVPVVEAAGAGAAVAELVEGDASLGYAAADESFGGAEPVGDLGDRQQRGHEGSHLLVRRWPAWRGRGGGGRGRDGSGDGELALGGAMPAASRITPGRQD